jgi:hypothetical protein
MPHTSVNYNFVSTPSYLFPNLLKPKPQRQSTHLSIPISSNMASQRSHTALRGSHIEVATTKGPPNPDSVLFSKVLDHVQVLDYIFNVMSGPKIEPADSLLKKGDFFNAITYMEGGMSRIGVYM